MTTVAIETEPTVAKPKPPLKVLILFLLFSLAISFALVELALRLIGFSFRLYPEKIQFGYPKPEFMESKYQNDDDVFWVQPTYFEKLDGFIKNPPSIIFMGDSCTEFGRYPGYLSEIFERKFGKDKVSVGKMGVAGWASFQGLQQLKRDIIRIKPKIATFYYGWNDHWVGYGVEDKNIAKLHSPIISMLQKFRVAQLVTKGWIALTRKEYSVTPNRVSLVDFEANLRAMVRISRENGITPVIFTAPTSQQKGKEPEYLKEKFIMKLEDLIPVHQSYAQAARNVAASEKAPLCDLAADFATIPQAELDKLFKTSGIHLWPQGDKRMAKFIYRCFEREGLLEVLSLAAQ